MSVPQIARLQPHESLTWSFVLIQLRLRPCLTQDASLFWILKHMQTNSWRSINESEILKEWWTASRASQTPGEDFNKWISRIAVVLSIWRKNRHICKVQRSEPVLNQNLTTLNCLEWSGPRFGQMVEPEPWSHLRFKKYHAKTRQNWTTAALFMPLSKLLHTISVVY